jgi:subtilisin family serine protease
MPDPIQEELKAVGVAHVIVELNPSASPPPSAKESLALGLESVPGTRLGGLAMALERHFVSSELSQEGFLLRALARKAKRKARPGAAELGLESVGAAGAPPPPPPKMRVYPNLGLMFGTVDRVGLKALRDDDRVAGIHAAPAISLIRPVAVRAATLRRKVTWGLDHLGVPELWDQGLMGAGILVGHLDTGVDARHPALKKAIAQFAEFDLIGNPVPDAKPHDTDQHGTHTAGTIAGRRVTTTAFGVAPEAKLASAIVIEGGQVIARILAGMDWAVGHQVRILSMSLGLRGYREDFLPLVRVLRARNVLPVFAVGNEGPGTSRSPGNYEQALSVGACDEHDVVADFSSSQQFLRRGDRLVPDLVAPGVGIISSVPGGGYAAMDGTSMATPHIAGLAALLFQAVPTATADQVEAALFASCQLPSTMVAERANRGVPNGPRALGILRGGTGTAPVEPPPRLAARTRARRKKG